MHHSWRDFPGSQTARLKQAKLKEKEKEKDGKTGEISDTVHVCWSGRENELRYLLSDTQ